MDFRRGLPAWLIAVTALWVSAAATGLWFVWRFDNAPGAAATAPADWPADSRLVRLSGRSTLVLVAHPQCSCTVASLGELAEVLARADVRPNTYVVFLKPQGFSTQWVESDLWQMALRLPGVTVLRDEDGREAQRFGAATSGQTFLYDERGTLVFSGGITGARAHAGDNVGRQSLVALLTQASAAPQSQRVTAAIAPRTSNVFGCPLFNSGT